MSAENDLHLRLTTFLLAKD